MCPYRSWCGVALLLWPIGALCAQETTKAGDDVPPPDGAAPKSVEQSPRPSPRRIVVQTEETNSADDSEKASKPSEESASDAREDEIHFTREIPEDLGEALSLALGHNPLLLVAEAKVREVQAEYDQVSLSLVHDVTVAFREYAHEKKTLETLNKSGRDVVPARQIREGQEKLERAKARLNYMLGIDTRPEGRWKRLLLTAKPTGTKLVLRGELHSPSAEIDMTEERRSPVAQPRDAGELTISRELQAALNTTTDFDFTEQPLSEVLAYLGERNDLQFLKKGNLDIPVTANLKGVTVQAALQALADLTQTSFVFRDYGILVVQHPSEAETYRDSNAPMIGPAFLGRQPSGKPPRHDGGKRE